MKGISQQRIVKTGASTKSSSSLPPTETGTQLPPTLFETADRTGDGAAATHAVGRSPATCGREVDDSGLKGSIA